MPALRAVLSAVATFLVVAEVVCRLLPVSTATETDYRRDPLIRTYPAHHRWVTSTGWDLRRPQWMAANNAGFAAAHDFSFNPQAIALIGDSYVEASMLKTSERLAHRLEMVLGGQRPVYAMGSPGTSLLDYAERIRWARQHYGVRDVVLFVEASDVLQSYCGSGNVEGVCLDAATGEVRTSTLPPASDAKRWLRQSAFAQYLVSQLRFDPGRIWQQVLAQSRAGHAPKDVRRPDGPQRDPKRIDAVNQVLQAFLARTDRQPPGRLIMVLDGRRGVARPGRAWPAEERKLVAQGLRAAGAVVVDLEPVFAAHDATSALRLDIAPNDAHLNALGLDLVAKATAAAMAGPGVKTAVSER